jgi:hypothetical protein
VPGDAINTQNRQWPTLDGKYLFNGYALVAMFRGNLSRELQRCGFALPPTPNKWVVQCKHVGRGLPALKYLSRYLYRGVISNHNIVADDGTFVTFRYQESRSAKTKTRRLRGEDFIALVLQHTLPKGFRRARDYGFLHGNAKRTLTLVQWILKINITPPPCRARPAFICHRCQGTMVVIGFSRPDRPSG